MRVSFTTLLVVLSILLVIGSLNFFKPQVNTVFFSFARPAASLLWSYGDWVSGFLNGTFSGTALEHENAALVQENLSLRQQLATFEDVKGELNELRGAFGLEELNGLRLLAAEIYGKRTGEEVLLINRGSSGGVQQGMVVVTASGVLVGRVTEVFLETSQIRLISSKDVSFDAAVQGRTTSGVLRGKGSGKLLFSLVPREQTLEESDVLVTSNVAEVFPENLLVGRVTKVTGSDVEAFWQADIAWFFNLSHADQVFLIQ